MLPLSGLICAPASSAHVGADAGHVLGMDMTTAIVSQPKEGGQLNYPRQYSART
jgi:hypothetical protein